MTQESREQSEWELLLVQNVGDVIEGEGSVGSLDQLVLLLVLELEIDCDLRVDERGEEWMSEFMSNQQ